MLERALYVSTLLSLQHSQMPTLTPGGRVEGKAAGLPPKPRKDGGLRPSEQASVLDSMTKNIWTQKRLIVRQIRECSHHLHIKIMKSPEFYDLDDRELIQQSNWYLVVVWITSSWNGYFQTASNWICACRIPEGQDKWWVGWREHFLH